MPAALLQKLQSDVFVFSGMKTYTQLKEASLLLLDENKQIKPYHQFEQDILKIDNTYNRNYLQAEYQHATSAAQSASQWNDYMQDGNRYNLQIRTAGDDRVRESHAVLNGITLPAQHEFWKTHWTPFDWRCRCNIVQVLRDDYNESDIGIAHAAAQQAIPEMFRYNPGREGVIFPKKHPYYPQHCNGAKLNLTGLVGYATWLLDAENDRCKAKRIIDAMAQAKFNIEEENKNAAESRYKTREELFKTIPKNHPLKIAVDIEHLPEITLTRSSVKTMLSKYHNKSIDRDNFILNIKNEMKNAKYVGWAEDEMVDGKQKHPDVLLWQYHKVMIGGKQSFVCVKKTKDGNYKPYSIETNDEFKKIRGVKKGTPIR